MATLAAAAARQAATLTRISTPRTPFQAANLVQKRGLADHHGPARVNVWEDPMSPSKWKEEHMAMEGYVTNSLLSHCLVGACSSSEGTNCFQEEKTRRKRKWWKQQAKFFKLRCSGILDNNVLLGPGPGR
ncbi:hypothetical protein F8388_015376 [Cannabis sativa]|uniref:Uncharacterized protein n=1 Tax=Cannabis sativa TaxID=3483 RepID=A0A7J6GI76_CANSA|nr:hypothetical protein F8388_015376 [Cannabis sativa]